MVWLGVGERWARRRDGTNRWRGDCSGRWAWHGRAGGLVGGKGTKRPQPKQNGPVDGWSCGGRMRPAFAPSPRKVSWKGMRNNALNDLESFPQPGGGWDSPPALRLREGASRRAARRKKRERAERKALRAGVHANTSGDDGLARFRPRFPKSPHGAGHGEVGTPSCTPHGISPLFSLKTWGCPDPPGR